MKAILICPADRGNFAFFTRQRPFALVPFLGRSLIDLWLAELAVRGAKHVVILAADRPDAIRARVRKGEAWGISLEVIPESRESTPEEARERYRKEGEAWLPAPSDIAVADRLPGDVAGAWATPAAWFEAARERMPAAAADRVGMREHAPGVHVHVRARLSPGARLVAPCWIGGDVWVGTGSVVGPGTVLEAAAYVDDGATVERSWVGPATMVGALTEVRDSLAWGRGLYRWTTGSYTEVLDAFLLADLAQRVGDRGGPSWWERLLALLVVLSTAPLFVPWAWIRGRKHADDWFATQVSVRAPRHTVQFAETFRLHRFPGLAEPWSRWPELWNIVRGEMRWIGNRPLTPAQAELLSGEFERLWLEVAAGLVSLADAEGTADGFGDEARVHAGFYAVQRTRWRDLGIVWRGLRRALGGRWTASVSRPGA